MSKNNTLSYPLRPTLFFVVNKNSGRWIFSRTHKEISEDNNISKLNEWDNLIKTLVINVTDRCNLNCIYCSRQYTRKKPVSMNKELIKTILEKSSEYAEKNNIKLTVQFHGGEPLIEFNKIIESIDSLPNNKQKNLRLRIQTNGTLLNERIMKKCQKRSIEVGISLDGRQIENDLTRKDEKGEGTFNKIIKALGLIKKYQKDVRCLTVVTNINIENLDKILDFFNKIGINDIGFLPLYEEPRTRTIKREIVPSMKKLADSQKNLFDRWIELLKSKKYSKLNISTFQILIWNFLASNSPTKKFRTNCGVGVNSLFVESDGTVWGCGAFSYANKLKLGDFKKQTLSEIQENKAYFKLKERITANVKKCKNCAFQFICKGGCIANGFRKNKNIFDTDIWCKYWEEIIKYILIKIHNNPDIIKLIPDYNIKNNPRRRFMDNTSESAIDFYKNLGTKGMASLTNKKRDKATIKFILPFLKKSDKILDMACGYGRVSFLLAERGYNVEGIDISTNLIKDARKEARKRKLNIKFKIGDMRELPYKNEKFEKIICLWSSFNHLLTEKDQVKVVKEIFRVLKNKGKCIMELPNVENKWAREKIKKYGRIVPYIINGIEVNNYIHDKKTLKRLSKKSDFKKYKIKFANIVGRRRIIWILEK